MTISKKLILKMLFQMKIQIYNTLDYLNLFFMAGIFMIAGISKIIDFSSFPSDIINYDVLPTEIVFYLAIYLVFFEIIISLGLFCSKIRLCASFCITGLLILFCIAIIQALARGIDINCGCFGESTPDFLKSGLPLLFRDLLLLLMALRLNYFVCENTRTSSYETI